MSKSKKRIIKKCITSESIGSKNRCIELEHEKKRLTFVYESLVQENKHLRDMTKHLKDNLRDLQYIKSNDINTLL